MGERSTVALNSMGIQFGDPPVPKYVGTAQFDIGIVLGLITVIAAVFAVDKLGNFMFRRGYAKPFFILGRRLHHVWVYALVPSCYLAICSLMFRGYVQVILGQFWYRIGFFVPLVAACLAIDFLGDKGKSSSIGLVRHEWVYALIPVYVFAFVINVFV